MRTGKKFAEVRIYLFCYLLKAFFNHYSIINLKKWLNFGEFGVLFFETTAFNGFDINDCMNFLQFFLKSL